MPKKKPSGSGAPGCNPEQLHTYFTSKKGKVFYARDYGYKAWPIGRRGRGKKK